MKKIISILFAAICLVSCSKDPDIVYSPATKKLVKLSYNDDNYSEVSYQPDGKVKQVVTKMGQYLYTKTFTYTAGNITYLTTLSGKKTEIGDYKIVNGKVTEFTWTYYDFFEAPINTLHETFEYNAQGLISKRSFNDGAYYTYSYNPDGDLIERIYHDQNGVATDKNIYTYFPNEDKFPWFNEDNDDGSGFFLPAKSKHMIKGLKNINLPGGTLDWEYSITHDIDKDGYATKSNFAKIAGGNGGYVVMSEFQAQ